MSRQRSYKYNMSFLVIIVFELCTIKKKIFVITIEINLYISLSDLIGMLFSSGYFLAVVGKARL